MVQHTLGVEAAIATIRIYRSLRFSKGWGRALRRLPSRAISTRPVRWSEADRRAAECADGFTDAAVLDRFRTQRRARVRAADLDGDVALRAGLTIALRAGGGIGHGEEQEQSHAQPDFVHAGLSTRWNAQPGS